MPILYILCGLPASGKSTYARELAAKSDIQLVSRDEIRFSLLVEGEDYFAHEKKVFRTFANKLAQLLIQGYDVIADATHLTAASRRKLLCAIDNYYTDYTICYLFFTTPFDICKRRNDCREGRERVPDKALIRMKNSFEYFTFEELYEPRLEGVKHIDGQHLSDLGFTLMS